MILESYISQIQASGENYLRYGVLCWPFLAVPIAIALIHFDLNPFRREAWTRLFAKDLYGHRSSLQDYRVVAINLTISLFIFSFFLVLLNRIDLQGYFESTFGASPWRMKPSLLLDFIYTVFIFIALDFTGYALHWLQHRLPVFWEFHRVHHSAEVLTPFTSGRAHPIENAINLLVLTLAFAVSSALFRFLFVTDARQVLLNGLDFLTFFGLMLFGHLKHSHVWIRLPSALSRVVISPAMHQVHHSHLFHHRDRNLGVFLSVWDGLFGTLYLPRADEQKELALGISAEEPNPYRTLREIYWGSLLGAVGRLRGKYRP